MSFEITSVVKPPPKKSAAKTENLTETDQSQDEKRARQHALKQTNKTKHMLKWK